MGTLNSNRSIYLTSLTDTFTFSSATANFLKKNGVVVFYKDPSSGQIRSYRHGQSINALTDIRKYSGYQFDNKGSEPITFGNRFLGFGVQPDLSAVGVDNPPPPTSNYNFGNPSSGWVLRSPLPNGSSIREFWLGNSVRDESLDFVPNAGVDEISALLGYNYTIARNMTPGAPLDYQRDNGAAFTTEPYGQFQNALSQYIWDYINFQPFDRDVLSDLQAIGDFLDIAVPVSGSGLQPWIYQRWMRKRQDGPNDAAYWNATWLGAYNPNAYFYENRDYFNQLLSAVRTNETRQKPCLIVPVGDAMWVFNQMAANGEIPGYSSAFDLYSDDIHLDNPGSYLTTLVFASAYNYRSFVGTAVPSGYGSIPSNVANIMQNIAWNTVQNHPNCAYIPA